MRDLILEARTLLATKGDDDASNDPDRMDKEYAVLVKKLQRTYGGGRNPIDEPDPNSPLVNPGKAAASPRNGKRGSTPFTTEH